MSAELKDPSRRVAGVKQVARALAQDRVQRVYLAEDAEKRVLADLVESLRLSPIVVTRVGTMRELARMCGIDVQTAAAAILKPE